MPKGVYIRVIPKKESWTQEQKAYLIQLLKEGFNAKTIADAINFHLKPEKPITRAAVLGKIFRLRHKAKEKREHASSN